MLLSVISILSALLSLGICLLSGWGLHWLWLLPVCFVAGLLGQAIFVVSILLISVLFIDFDKPQEKDNPFYRLLVKLLAPAVLTVVGARIHAKGFKQAPKDGRFLLVCNHLHELDPIVLLKYFPNSQLAFISKQETKKLFVVGPLMHKIMCQFVNRENDKEALKTIINCIRLIKEDRASVAVFPEGYIRPNRKLHHFRSGVFKIATKTNVPIVVCTITNTNHLIRNFKKMKSTDIDLHLVKVIQPEEYEGLTTVELGEQIYQMMAQDLGPDRVSPDDE